jgi:hypothetical protein
MSSYGGHCAFIVAVHVAQRQRQVRIEFVFVRERKRERKKKKRIKQTKEKETKRNKWRRKREEEDLFSLVHQPNPLLGHSLFFCTHYIMSGSLLLLLLFPEKTKQK